MSLLQNPDYFNEDFHRMIDRQTEEDYFGIKEFAEEIGKKMAVAITNSGQLLFLYRIRGEQTHFENGYSLRWTNKREPWRLDSGECSYLFQLPDSIMKQWLEHSRSELDMKRSALNCKASFLSNMVVYYMDNQPHIQMIFVERYKE